MKLLILQLVFVIASINLSDEADLDPDCIYQVVLTATTGNGDNVGFSDNNHTFVLRIRDRGDYRAPIPPPDDYRYPYIVDFSVHFDLEVDLTCLLRSDIEQVRIEAGGDDGWFIESADTQFVTGLGESYKLTSNPALNVWVDGDQEDLVSYNPKVLVLTLPSCITSVTVTATTGPDGSTSTYGLLFQLEEDYLMAMLSKDMPPNEVYTTVADLLYFARESNLCMQKGDIHQLQLVPFTPGESWCIVDIKVVANTGEVLAVTDPLNKCSDPSSADYPYDSTVLVLTLA